MVNMFCFSPPVSYRYRTFYKPKYKVGFKTVTELEWRCCPGYSGENCYDGPTPSPDGVMPPFKGAGLPHRPGTKGFPHGPRPPLDQRPGSGQLEPGRPFPNVPDHRPIPTGQLPAGGGRQGGNRQGFKLALLLLSTICVREHFEVTSIPESCIVLTFF